MDVDNDALEVDFATDDDQVLFLRRYAIEQGSVARLQADDRETAIGEVRADAEGLFRR